MDRRRPTFRFFKLMLSPSSLSTKLRIPKYFVRKVLRNEIASTAILKVPTGETRIVALVEEDNELWFRDGWKEFVEHFSIDYNYFLIFEYEGNSKFNVHIFDLTASEITYPSNAHNTCQEHNDQPCHNVIENDYDNDDAEKSEIVHKHSVSLKDSVVQPGSDDEEMEIVEECNPFGTRYPFWLKKYEGLMKAAISARISLPKNPFFVAAIKPYVLHDGFLNVPKPFGQDHLGPKTKLIKLEAYDGRRWEVKFLCYSTKYTFCAGWKIFVQANDLQVGDVCVFELVDVKENVLKVHVAKKSEIKVAEQLDLTFDDDDDAKKPEILRIPSVSLKDSEVVVQQVSDDEDMEIVEECTPFGYPCWLKKYEGLMKAAISAGISLPKNPFFVAAIKLYVLDNGFLNVPRPFSQDHLGHEPKVIKLEAYDGRRWEVKFLCYSTKYTFRAGWKIFVQANDLQVGDVCVFELLDVKEYVLKVHVAKKSEIKVAEELDLPFEE